MFVSKMLRRSLPGVVILPYLKPKIFKIITSSLMGRMFLNEVDNGSTKGLWLLNIQIMTCSWKLKICRVWQFLCKLLEGSGGSRRVKLTCHDECRCANAS